MQIYFLIFTCLHIYLSICIFTCIFILLVCIYCNSHACLLSTYIHTNIHTYIHTCIHTYIHTYIHFFMNGNTERAQFALSRVCIPKKRKRKAIKRTKQIYKISKRVMKKNSCHLVPKVVIDLPLKEGRLKEAGDTEEGREFQRREVEGKKPLLNRLILALRVSHNSCGQMMWNVAEPFEVEYRRPIHQGSDQSNSGRKEMEKRRRDRRSRFKVKERSPIRRIAFDSTLSRREV